MDELLIFYITLAIIGCLLIGLNLFVKTDIYSSIIIVLSCMFVGFIGFLKYASLSTSYPNRKILVLCFALTSFLPCILNILNALTIKNNKIKPLVIKIATIAILVINLALMFLL